VKTIWQPSSAAPIHWQWQIGTPFNLSTDLIPNVTVYDIDYNDNSAAVVSSLHAQGFIVIAYVSFGTYENWRPDAASFPAAVKGATNGWPGENWLDIRSDAVKTIMAARLDLIKAKGFDAVEPDNIDGYSNSTGFPLTTQDQLNFNQWIAAQCHQRGLSVGLKNDVDQAAALQPYFDWTLNEESYKYNEYSGLSVFTNNNKAVFEVEYGKNTAQASALNALHFNSLTRDLDLVSPSSSGYTRLPCISDSQNSWTQTNGTASKLAFTTQPGSTNTSGIAFNTQPRVSIEDASGNVITSSNAAVTIAITAGTGVNGAVPSGTATVNAINGVATFSGLNINLAGTGYTLTAASSGLTSAVSSAISITAGTLDHLISSPSNPSVVMGGAQTYSAQGFDSANNPISGLSITWSCTNQAAGSISSSGIFTGGSTAGSYANVIQAATSGKTGMASVTVTARAASKLAFTTQPGSTNTSGIALNTQPRVSIEDASGNVITSSNAAVTIAITAGTGVNGAVLSGTATVNAINGVATFSGLNINLAGTGYTLTAASSGLTSAVSNAINIGAAIINGGGGGTGGGGGGGFAGGYIIPPPPPVVVPGVTSIAGSVDKNGILTSETKTLSADGKLTLILPQGTRFLAPDGTANTQVSMQPLEAAQQPAAPVDAKVIGLIYELGPTGSTFDPPVNLTFNYDESILTDGILSKDLKLAYWDETGEKWVNLDIDSIDTVNHTITAKISHFSKYAVLGYLPAPAQFSVLPINVSSTSVQINEPVKVLVTIVNTGGKSGFYTVVFKANGVEEGSKTVSLDAGAKTTVEFALTKNTANTYNLEANGQRSSIEVTNPPTALPEPVQTQIPVLVETTENAIITPVVIPVSTVTAAQPTMVRLALLGEVIAIALVLIGLTTVLILLRRKHLMQKE
jgi:hypothetical protein